MRTIKKTLLYRLAAQAQEADVQGLSKVSEMLTSQITKNATSVRETDAGYVYSGSDFEKDVEEKIWDIVIRASDFYNVTVDAAEVQPLVEKYAEELMHDIMSKLAINHGVGAYEPLVSGQEKISLEIHEEDINV
jgi:hypothetical protein